MGSTIRFQKSNFQFTHNEDSLLIIESLNKSGLFRDDSLSPALPYININLLIGRNDEMDDFSFQNYDNILFTNVDMATNPVNVPSNNDAFVFKKEQVLFKKSIYPDKNVEFTGTFLMDGYKYLSFCVCPFTYNTETRILYLSDSLNITFSLNESDIKKNDGFDRGRSMREIVKSMIINPDEMDSLYVDHTNIQLSQKHNKTLSRNNQIEYVIITDSSMVDAFEPLSKWKTMKGVRASITSIQDINNTYTSYSSIQSKIKHYLFDLYQQGLKYVLLGGNHSIVPSRICYLPHFDTTYNTPTDLYYACFDNDFEWNADGDSIYGEIVDNVDFSPEIIVSRILVRNSLEIKNYINRLVKYEQTPDTSFYNNKILMCGNILHYFYDEEGNRYSASQYSPEIYHISDAQIYSEQIFDESIYPYWSGIDRFRLYDTWSDHPQGNLYKATAEHVLTEMSKGYSFVDVTTHGWKDCWGHFVLTTLITNEDILSFVNTQNTIYVTIACQTNSFDDTDPCLSEAFFRNANSGILAYIGSSREGWIPSSVEYSKSFYRNLLSRNEKQVVPAVMRMKMDFVSQYNSFTSYRKLLYCINPLGDPEFSIYTNDPAPLSPVVVYDQNCNLSIQTGIDSCKICISSTDGAIYNVYDNVNNISYNNLDKECYVCITKPGYIPYIIRIGDNLYIQDETLVNKTIIIARRRYVCCHLTGRGFRPSMWRRWPAAPSIR